MDDHDGDHNRWHAHGFNNTGRDSDQQGNSPDLLAGPPGITAFLWSLVFVEFLTVSDSDFPARLALAADRDRGPPSPSLHA